MASTTLQTDAKKPLLIAHCGMEGCPMSQAQLLNSTKTSAGESSAMTDSLWGNLILSMAFQRDPEIQAISRKLGHVNTLTLASVAAISGLGLAQGITTLHTLNDDPHKKYPVILGLVGAGASVFSIGATIILSHRYQKELNDRELVIKNQVMTIINDFEGGEPTALDKTALKGLIGERATNEFMGIWQADHPRSSATTPSTQTTSKQPGCTPKAATAQM